LGIPEEGWQRIFEGEVTSQLEGWISFSFPLRYYLYEASLGSLSFPSCDSLISSFDYMRFNSSAYLFWLDFPFMEELGIRFEGAYMLPP
jgi:hypothetical protein